MDASYERPASIDKHSSEYRELVASLTETTDSIDRMEAAYRPRLCEEWYYDGGELMRKFHIGRTALQEYRLKGLIPHTRIGGVILYPHSGVEAVLQSNYCKPHIFG